MILGLFSAKVKEFDNILQKVSFAGCIDLSQMESDKGRSEREDRSLRRYETS
jgi:hypothetical protein